MADERNKSADHDDGDRPAAEDEPEAEPESGASEKEAQQRGSRGRGWYANPLLLVGAVLVAFGAFLLVLLVVGSEDSASPGESSTQQAAGESGIEASDEFCTLARERAPALAGVGGAQSDPAALEQLLQTAAADYRRLGQLADPAFRDAFESQAEAIEELDAALATIGYRLENASDEVVLKAFEVNNKANETAGEVNRYLAEGCGLVLVPAQESPMPSP